MAYLPTSSKTIKITKTFTDFSSVTPTNTITLSGILPAKSVITGYYIVVNTAFTGPGVIAATLSAGKITPSDIMPISSVLTIPGTPPNSTVLNILGSTSVAQDITLTLATTGGNTNALNQGSVDIYIDINNYI